MSKIMLFKETGESFNPPGISMNHIEIQRFHPDGSHPVGHTS